MSDKQMLTHNLTPTCKALLAGLPHPAWTCLPHGPCNHLSARWVEYTGVPEEQHLDFGWLEALHPEDRDRVVKEWTSHSKLEERFDTQFRIRRHDGVYRSFQTSACPIKGDDGEILFWLGANIDVQNLLDTKDQLRETNRRLEHRVEKRTQALKEVYERMDLATEIANLGVWEWEPTSDLVEWDARMYRLLDLGQEKQGNQTLSDWLKLLHVSERQGFRQALHELLGAEEQLRTVIRLDSGQSELGRFLEIVAGVYRVDSESESRVIGMARDITQERMSALRLGHTQRLLKQFVKHAPAAIAMLDTNLCYIEVSDRWIVDYGLESQGELIGRCHYDVFPDVPEEWKRIHQRVLQGHVEKMEEDPFERDDGSVVWLQWECQPWYTIEEEVGGLLFFTRVITRQKEMELELVRQKKALERSNTDLEHFARAASHDLQTPLRAVSSCVELLQQILQSDERDEVQELLSHVVSGVTRMRELIKGVLAFSTLESTLHFETVDLEVVVGQVLSDHREALSRGQLKIEVPELPAVEGVSSLLVQLFQNLLGNAVKYGGTKVSITVTPQHEKWKFGVHDNGIGIELEYQSCIFEIFKRLHSYSAYSGSGVGLASCRRIVAIHGGEIWVDSKPGEGSSFYFTISKERK